MFLKSLKLLPVILTFGLVSQASASSIFLSSSNITLSLGNIDIRSYDGAGYDNVGAFAGSPSTFQEYSSFDGGVAGTDYEMFFLSSVADYKNQNTFGLLNEQNQFVSSISGASALGSKVTYTQQADQKLKFGFQSPESLFFSKASENKDGRSHILSLIATTDAVLTIPRADQLGNSITFNLLAGDILCFMEDLLGDSRYKGNLGSDFDYNDFLTVIRAKPTVVPEPGTICLLGLGALTALRRRRAS
jgi:hypothetical protein